jgi:hypothetical protein
MKPTQFSRRDTDQLSRSTCHHVMLEVESLSECGKCGQGLLNKLSQITLYDDVIAWKSLEQY